MATIKAISPSHSLKKIIDYVTKKEKTETKLLSGLNCEPNTVLDEMNVTKLLWRKTDGRQYKHFTQNFHKDDNVTPEEAHELAIEFAEKYELFKGFEVLIATHKICERIHTHFIVNSVNFETGYKFQMRPRDLKAMKKLSDDLCKARGLHICEKGKTFEGEEREELVSYDKDTYHLLKQAENGKVQSYVLDIVMALMDAKEIATSKEQFIEIMAEKGIDVQWNDNRKHITFVDIARQEQGEVKCKVRNSTLQKYYNIDFSKEALNHEFTENARRK